MKATLLITDSYIVTDEQGNLYENQEQIKALVPKEQYQIARDEERFNVEPLWENVSEEVFMKYNYRDGFKYRRIHKPGTYQVALPETEVIRQFFHGAEWIDKKFPNAHEWNDANYRSVVRLKEN